MFRQLIFIFIVAGSLFTCEPSKINDKLFEKGKVVGTNKNKKLEEASGLVASVRNTGYLWTHNDSGNDAELYLLDETATTKKVFRLANIVNRDWEDIAFGPGPEENTGYVYIGDIGDNSAKYPVKYIYRLKEPALDDPQTISAFDTLIVKLSDRVRDTETLMSDPLTGNLYLISKREDSVRVFEIPYPFKADTLIANKVATLDFNNIVAGDISRDGKEVLLKNYKHIYYWKRNDSESIADLLSSPATEIPYEQEMLGEAIGWATDGSGFFTLSENGKGERAKLYFYKRK